MLYIRFLNLQDPLHDVEKMYTDGDVKYGDIVCQQYNDKSSHLFMNGTWIKTVYNSKIKQNNEIEDDIEFLSTAIGNNSTNIDEVSTRLNDTSVRLNDVSTRVDNTSNNLNDTSIRLNDVSTRLKDDYVNKTQYLKDEELICSTFAELNNKINTNVNIVNASISNTYATKQQVNTIGNSIWNRVKETYVSNEKYNNDIETINNKISTYYTNDQIDTFVDNLNTSIKDTSDNLNIVSGKVDEVSTRLNDTSVRLLNYLTINQYLKDEELIASTFADLNNKINNVGNIDFSNYYTTEVIDNKIKDINTSINNTSTRIEELESLYTNTQIDTFISNLNTSISNVSSNVKTVSDKLIEVSTRLGNSSTKLNNVSTNVDDVSSRLNDTSVRLLNYLTINQYVKDEELIASTFADVNNKINSLYAEIAELKEQLNSSTK